MDAAQCPLVINTWRGVARSIAILSVILGIAGGASAQSRHGSGAGTLTRPWHATADAAPDGERTSTPTSTPARTSRAADELAAPDRAPARPSPVTFDLGIATHVPISVGIEANLTLPLGFLLRTHVGVTPEGYVGIINGVAQGLGAYDGNVGAIVSRSATSSFVLRTSAGMRPVPGHGFEILAGYTLIHGGSRIPTADFEAASGQSMDYPGLDSIGISATLHCLHVEIGWSGLLFDHLVIRGSIGWVHTLAADGAIDVPPELRARAGGEIEEIERGLRGGLTTFGYSPEARVGVAYQF